MLNIVVTYIRGIVKNINISILIFSKPTPLGELCKHLTRNTFK